MNIHPAVDLFINFTLTCSLPQLQHDNISVRIYGLIRYRWEYELGCRRFLPD